MHLMKSHHRVQVIVLVCGSCANKACERVEQHCLRVRTNGEGRPTDGVYDGVVEGVNGVVATAGVVGLGSQPDVGYLLLTVFLMRVLVTLQYNESTLLLVLKHMIYSLTHPTPPLEALTREHFRRRAPAIIRRCQRILDKTPSADATTTTHASSTAGAAGGGSRVGGGSSAGLGTGDEQESGERAEDGANDNVTDSAVGWADRSFACSVDPTARLNC